MPLKNPRNVRRPRLPEEGPTEVVELIHNPDLFSEGAMAVGGLPIFDADLLYSPALREVLESHDYRVALVSRNKWDCLHELNTEALTNAAPAVLLPFTWRELVAGVREFVRQTSALEDSQFARLQHVRVDVLKMEVRRFSGEVIILTAQEFKTLKYFLSNPERVLSRDELLNEAWGYENYPSTRTVDNHVLKLRHKLERDPARPFHFRTVHGVGYKFVP